MSDDCGDEIVRASAGGHRPWSPQAREESPLAAGPADPFTCLEEVDLFADLSAAEIEAMHLMVPERRFRPGELVYSQAQPVRALFILRTGRVRVFRVAEDGRALTMAILEPGAVFGEMLLVGQQMYDNYAEAIENSTVCQLTAEEVERYLLADPRIAVRISRLLGEQVARLEDRLLDLALRPLSARTAKALLDLAGAARGSRFAPAPSVRLTHEQLAGLLGATREATSKTMADFAAQGLIRQGRGRIVVKDVDALRAIARRTS
jgi:CRP/FNR family cyclic AMP-dependent transcriptional regulator